MFPFRPLRSRLKKFSQRLISDGIGHVGVAVVDPAELRTTPFNELPTVLAGEQVTFAIVTPGQGPDPGPAADGRPASEPEVTTAGP